MQNCIWADPQGAFDSALFANHKIQPVFPRRFLSDTPCVIETSLSSVSCEVSVWIYVCNIRHRLRSYLFVHSRVSTFLRSSLFSLEQVSTLWWDRSTAGSLTGHGSSHTMQIVVFHTSIQHDSYWICFLQHLQLLLHSLVMLDLHLTISLLQWFQYFKGLFHLFKEGKEEEDSLLLQSVHVLFLLPATLLSWNLRQREWKQSNVYRERSTLKVCFLCVFVEDWKTHVDVWCWSCCWVHSLKHLHL